MQLKAGKRIQFIEDYVLPNKFSTGLFMKYSKGDCGVVSHSNNESWFVLPDKSRDDGMLIILPKGEQHIWEKCIKII